MSIAKITVAKTAGFCYGVERAVNMAYSASGKYQRIFTYGPLIHNRNVVEDLEKKGISVLERIEDVLPGDAVIIRSHGVGRSVYEELEKKQAVVIDATCPNVKRIHKLVEECRRNGQLVLIAGDKNHPEVEGILGYGDENCFVFANCEELATLLRKNYEIFKKGVAILSQTHL